MHKKMNQQKELRKGINFTVSQELWQEFKYKCSKENRPMNAVLIEFMRNKVRGIKWYQKKTEFINVDFVDMNLDKT